MDACQDQTLPSADQHSTSNQMFSLSNTSCPLHHNIELTPDTGEPNSSTLLQHVGQSPASSLPGGGTSSPSPDNEAPSQERSKPGPSHQDLDNWALQDQLPKPGQWGSLPPSLPSGPVPQAWTMGLPPSLPSGPVSQA